ncbi:hexosaminidase [Bacteroides faecichinchillae]|uniref:beta-N-acetylhexosaminidase n=2 Tax=Bacteroides faecichinchillae TaxID=871325 RepID=A0A1M5ABV8_9BACE|nr:family 20 glycosylhydrolase [Bacteroides faecichinchillae]SHF27739.1 hexosaminidase [Bacteroides faecichinchillae]
MNIISSFRLESKNLCVLFVLSLSLLFACAPERVQVNLIPQPVSIKQSKGYFKVDSVKAEKEGIESYIHCTIDSALKEIGNEGYLLSVTPERIELSATTSTGIYYGKKTLYQLLTSQGIPCIAIKDYPRFQYRGMHLDVSRHFFSKEEVLKLLDAMSYYKINTFHFHLTDNGGWRIQIDKYPKLTSMGSYRTEKDWLKWWDGDVREFVPENTPGAYGGYYTKEDIRDILQYAAERHINVIPEIEFPAHSDEVFVGYPELCCMGKPYTSGEFCIGNEKTFTFMEDVLSEIIELFPSKYIHVGGDEARKTAWKGCPKCQALMKRMNMKSLDDLQCYIIQKAETFLNSKGRTMIGWDEILKNDLDSSSIVMSYRGQRGAIVAANKGFRAVMTPGEVLYFDWYQAEPRTQPQAMYGFSPIKKMYSFNPVPINAITSAANEELVQSKPISSDTMIYIFPGNAHKIIGVQGSTWSEFIPDEEHLEYMIFPRLLAVAEVAWTSQENRDWQSFKCRVNTHISQLKVRGIRPFTLSDNVELTTRIISDNEEVEVTLDAEKVPVEIHYTTDGSEPCIHSAIYEQPFILKKETVVKAAIFKGIERQGRVLKKHVGLSEEIKNYYEYSD